MVSTSAGLVFDWLYPAHFPTILACLDAWSDEPAVSTPILKFMAEFVMNKTQRLAFDASSASGILLFREVSKVSRSGRDCTAAHCAASCNSIRCMLTWQPSDWLTVRLMVSRLRLQFRM